MIILDKNQDNTNREDGDKKVLFFDVTVRMEGNVRSAALSKREQYLGPMAAIQAAGYEVETHVLLVGVHGTIPHMTTIALKALGWSPSQIRRWSIRVGRFARRALIKIHRTRRSKESALENAKDISGFARYKWYLKIKRELKWASARPPG